MLDDKQSLCLSIPNKEQCRPHCHTRTSLINNYRQQTVFIVIINALPMYVQFRKQRYVYSLSPYLLFVSKTIYTMMRLGKIST